MEANKRRTDKFRYMFFKIKYFNIKYSVAVKVQRLMSLIFFHNLFIAHFSLHGEKRTTGKC